MPRSPREVATVVHVSLRVRSLSDACTFGEFLQRWLLRLEWIYCRCVYLATSRPHSLLLRLRLLALAVAAAHQSICLLSFSIVMQTHRLSTWTDVWGQWWWPSACLHGGWVRFLVRLIHHIDPAERTKEPSWSSCVFALAVVGAPPPKTRYRNPAEDLIGAPVYKYTYMPGVSFLPRQIFVFGMQRCTSRCWPRWGKRVCRKQRRLREWAAALRVFNKFAVRGWFAISMQDRYRVPQSNPHN